MDVKEDGIKAVAAVDNEKVFGSLPRGRALSWAGLAMFAIWPCT
jgi:hypothetical protein